MAKTPPRLFQPLQLRGLEVPHRLWVSPMCQYSAVNGFPQAWHLAHLGSFAIGRAGLVYTEATAVEPRGRISPADTGIWSDAQAEAWAPIVAFLREQGVPVAVQLAHAGRKASTRPPYSGRGYVDEAEGGWRALGPSAAPYGRLPDPNPLSGEDVREIVEAFGAAAERSVRAGFDAVEVHGAHGYLIDSFLSPLSNHRTDAYGGSFENRVRFAVEVVERVRTAVPDAVPVFVRLSGTHWVDGGWDIEDTVRLVPLLEAAGADLISISSGGNDAGQSIPVGPGYQLPLARRVREVATVPVGAAGMISSPEQAETALVDGAADVILAARQFLREPTFALRAAADLGGELEWPRQYRMAKFDGSIP